MKRMLQIKRLLLIILLLATVGLTAWACESAPDLPSGTSAPAATMSTGPPAELSPDGVDVADGDASQTYAPDVYRLQPGELVLAAEEDDIPALFAGRAYNA